MSMKLTKAGKNLVKDTARSANVSEQRIENMMDDTMRILASFGAGGLQIGDTVIAETPKKRKTNKNP